MSENIENDRNAFWFLLKACIIIAGRKYGEVFIMKLKRIAVLAGVIG